MSWLTSAEKLLLGATPDQVHGWLGAAEKLIADAHAAVAQKGKNASADIQVAIDVADALTGLPVVGEYATAAEKGLMVLQFVVANGVPHNSGEGGIGAAPEGNSNAAM